MATLHFPTLNNDEYPAVIAAAGKRAFLRYTAAHDLAEPLTQGLWEDEFFLRLRGQLSAGGSGSFPSGEEAATKDVAVGWVDGAVSILVDLGENANGGQAAYVHAMIEYCVAEATASAAQLQEKVEYFLLEGIKRGPQQ